MITVGVDMATLPTKTAIARIEWTKGRAHLLGVTTPADDNAIIDAIRSSDKAGIDCPLGWPISFIDFISAHSAGDAPSPPNTMTPMQWRNSLAFRRTDVVVQATGARPLSVATQLLVFAHTSPHRPGPRFHRSVIVPLRRPTSETQLLVHAAVAGLHQIYEGGFQLIKAGVMLLDLAPGSRVQHELDLEDDAQGENRGRLMVAMDGVNGRFGKGTVHVAATGLDDRRREWGMRQERRTPNYTTDWREVPVARA